MRLHTTDQLDFANSVSALLTKSDLLTPLRQGPGRRPANTGAWEALLELGVLEPALDGDVTTTCLVAERLGQHAAPVPFLSTLMASVLLQGLGVPTDGARHTHGLFGPDGRCTAPRLRLQDGLVSGTLPFAPDADMADTVIALTEDGSAVAVAVADIRLEELVSLDATQPLDQLHVDAAPAVVLCDDPQQVERSISHAVDIGLAAHCSTMVGLMDWMLDATVEYAKQRVQFGQAIASRQAVKHSCAEMLARTESSRATTIELATATENAEDGLEVIAATTKAWVSDSADDVAGRAMQLHGGIGFTWEHDLHHYFKRVTTGATLFGTADSHRRRLASHLTTPLS